MILIYTGEGKGKTSASVGQAIRAIGRGMCVAFGQFMKRPGQAGEQALLHKLLGDLFYAGGEGFYRDPAAYAEHRAAALDVLEWAHRLLKTGSSTSASLDMLVLDEALYALGSNLLTREELQTLLDACHLNNVHLVLSGRNLPEWLSEQADLITEMRLIKHPYQKGVKAQAGIEY